MNQEEEKEKSQHCSFREKMRQTKEKVIQDFKRLKKADKLDKKQLEILLYNCNTYEELISYYLEYLKNTKDKDYTHQLLYYYTIISPDLCRKHGIEKITEKKRFHDLIGKIINEKYIMKIVREEVSNRSPEVEHLYSQEIKNIKDNEEIKKKEKEFIRWNNNYNIPIDFKDIYNEEYLYYKLSDIILNDYYKGQFGVDTRREGIITFYEIFKLLEPVKKKYDIFFEYICLGLLTISIKDENRTEITNIINSIKNYLEGEILSLDGMCNLLDNKKIKYSVDGNKISIQYKNKIFEIDNFNNYYFSELNIGGLLFQWENSYKNYLDSIRSFNSYIDKSNYFDGLLVKTILNYAKSNFSKTSIEKLFHINEKDYKELFNIVNSEKILNYIYFIPYNCMFDIERTSKIYSKIIIDASKDIFEAKYYYAIMSEKLKTSLKEFVNIVKRKYNFEHEQQHLITILLFYLYINEKRRINSLPKEINETRVQILTNEEYDKKKNQKNVEKEAGRLFEVFCYGQVQEKFKIKQLLFIANEENDKLDCIKYKNEYQKCSEKTLEEILSNFPLDQPLSTLVKEIKKGLEEEKKLLLEVKNIEKGFDEILDSYVTKKEDIQFPILEEFENIEIDAKTVFYNNYIFDKNEI